MKIVNIIRIIFFYLDLKSITVFGGHLKKTQKCIFEFCCLFLDSMQQPGK